ncbi:MAG: sirohydrochlorin nickelochelatase [Candidatus Bathyarchaeota archaeon]|nr:sirohydrochlorin nickelochelatase [Candidatus Bathyarchaeota archaeon]MCX8177209.1 sirohydrochlorin nickelochelatase [Candidatus Bathyarchaeota archaeon]MDW8193548.1 sirohydrochlorin nickelochelatase [Nitrososphaerota archaeon]
MYNVGLILVGHGSRKPQHKESLEKLAEIIRTRSIFKNVETAFMMINKPTIQEAVKLIAQRGVKRIVIIPVFMAAGSHTIEDIPKILGLKNDERITCKEGLEIFYGDPIGPDWRIAEIIEEKALKALGYKSNDEPPLDSYNLSAASNLFEMSMNRIREIIGDFLKCVPVDHAKIIERVVHATADAEFAKLIVISDGAIEEGISAIKSGAKVVADVKMVKAGVNMVKLRKFGGRVECYVDDERAFRMARESGITRTAAAMRLAINDGLEGGIALIGNSPTAAFELVQAVKNGETNPALIIATPVGFIGAAEAKEAVMGLAVPFITVRGPKGGSPVAAAIFNALLALAECKTTRL